MAIEIALRSLLIADSALAELVDDRVAPLIAGQQPPTPHITYQVTSGEDPSPTFEGPSGWTMSELELYAVAATYGDLITVCANARRILDGYSGTVNSVRIAPCRWVTEGDDEQGVLPGQATPVWMRRVTYRALHT